MSPGERESGRSLSDNKLDSDGNQTGRWPCRPARPVSPLLHSVPQQPGAWCWAVTPVSQTGRLSPERRDDFPKVTQSVRSGNVSGCLLSPSVHPIDGDSHYAGPEVSPFFAFCQWCRDFLRFILQASLIFFFLCLCSNPCSPWVHLLVQRLFAVSPLPSPPSGV